jgi:hypothetical protein
MRKLRWYEKLLHIRFVRIRRVRILNGNDIWATQETDPE